MKGVQHMDYDSARLIVCKAMAFDLINIIESNTEKKTYSPEEIKDLIDAYIKSSDQD